MSAQALHALGTQQQALLQALLARPGSAQAREAAALLPDFLDTRQIQTTRGLAVYQANGHAMAERALLSAYPVVAALIGALIVIRPGTEVFSPAALLPLIEQGSTSRVDPCTVAAAPEQSGAQPAAPRKP